jgi:hypothetical protein
LSRFFLSLSLSLSQSSFLPAFSYLVEICWLCELACVG